MNPTLVGFTLYKAALALDEAHNLKSPSGKLLNLVHRSLSPSNILYNDKAGIVPILFIKFIQ
jgi:serine/threonine protein kinase